MMLTPLNHSPNSAFTFCSIFTPVFAGNSTADSSPKTIDNRGFPTMDCIEPNELNFERFCPVVHLTFQKEDNSSNDSSNNVPTEQDHTLHSISNWLNDGVKKRKNKLQTKLEIRSNHKDCGRGGNCIASNITKTLIRVIDAKISKNAKTKFHQLIQLYSIKSQKENTIIILLILYEFAKIKLLSLSTLDQIIESFMKSLKESRKNCESKMNEEPERKGFHQKNRRMYANFIDINMNVYQLLKQVLQQQSSFELDLKQVSHMISDTYDRKQREIEKAMSKIRSIILNHDSLKALFGIKGCDIEGTFFEAVDYAYRRNLQKRCKQSKTKFSKFFEEIKRNNIVESEDESLFMCYLGLKLIDEKETQIWEEFINSLNLKKEYNQTEQEKTKLTLKLKATIPEQYQKLSENHSNDFSFETEVKMEEQNICQHKMKAFFSIYTQLKNQFEF